MNNYKHITGKSEKSVEYTYYELKCGSDKSIKYKWDKQAYSLIWWLNDQYDHSRICVSKDGKYVYTDLLLLQLLKMNKH